MASQLWQQTQDHGPGKLRLVSSSPVWLAFCACQQAGKAMIAACWNIWYANAITNTAYSRFPGLALAKACLYQHSIVTWSLFSRVSTCTNGTGHYVKVTASIMLQLAEVMRG